MCWDDWVDLMEDHHQIRILDTVAFRAQCGFLALRSPVCFAPRLMGEDGSGALLDNAFQTRRGRPCNRKWNSGGAVGARGIASLTAFSRSSTSMSMQAGKRWSASSRPRGVGIAENSGISSRQDKLPMHPSWRCGARTRSGSPCRSPAMPNGRCRMHGGPSPGAPKGNRNAFKHGRYSGEAVARRREVAALVRSMRALAAKA